MKLLKLIWEWWCEEFILYAFTIIFGAVIVGLFYLQIGNWLK